MFGKLQVHPGMFRAAFAVMELKLGKMLKHRQLINHEDSEIRSTWSTLSANEFSCLFQGVENRIKNLPIRLTSSGRSRSRQTDLKTSRTESLSALFALKKPKSTRLGWSWGAIELIT